MADRVYTLNGKKGVWRTIGGRRVFISDGDDLPTAMKKSGKFERKQKIADNYVQDLNQIEETRKKRIYSEEQMNKAKEETIKHYSARLKGKDSVADIPEAYRHYEQDYEREMMANEYFGGGHKLPNEKDYLPGGKKWNSEWENSREVKMDKEKYSNMKNFGKQKNWRQDLLDTDKKSADDIWKENEALYKEYGGFADTGDPVRNKEVEKAHSKWLRNRELARAKEKEADSDIPEWLEVGNKSVKDSDGFTTDYTLYLNTKDGKMATVFGDKDLYNVDTGTDMDFDTPEEAWDWFNNYTGFEEENRRELGTIKKTPAKKPSYWDSIKAGKVDTAGKSNRKEVSANIQAHIKDYYDSPEDFVNQMEAMKDSRHPTAWSWGQEYARGGGYLIYNSDMEDFLNTLNINPKGKKFNDEQVFNNYTSLIGRESAKMYDNIRKDAVKTLTERYSGTIDYLKETENMSTSEILELLKKLDK